MDTAKRRIGLGMLKVFNISLMISAFGVVTAWQVRELGDGLTLPAFLSMRVKLTNLLIFALILLAWHGIFILCGQYQSQRLARRRSIIANATFATTLASASIAVISAVFHVEMLTSRFVVLFWVCSSILVAGTRVLIRSGLEILRVRGRNLRNILILGTNHRALEFACQLDSTPAWGYRILGFVDDEWHEGRHPEQRHPLCCGFNEVSDYLRRNVVDEVANYLPLRSFYEHSSHIAALCEQHGILMRFDSQIFDLKIARARAEEVDGSAQITAHSFPLEGWPGLVKRVLDVILSFSLLVLLVPLLAAIGLIIKLTSKGPVFFQQERIGRNKRRFFIYKFRTMVPNAESMMPGLVGKNEATGPVFKIKHDPRITPLGRLLRRSSFDELPQLFNVLRGDMSLVGPRPLPVRDYEGFDQDWQRRRFSVRPGITCLWQISGRSNIGFDHWMKLDLQYLDEWSIWLDMKILALTIPAVLRGTGAV